MNRPKLEDYMPEDTGISDVHRMFIKNPELYRYICALDAYADYLEDEVLKRDITEHSKEFWKNNPPPAPPL